MPKTLYMSEKSAFLGIKKFRERVNLKQNELARELGQIPQTYHHWENGVNDPPFNVVQKLFEMGATVEELFDVPYSSKPPRADLKVSKEEAIEIVRVGMSGLIGSVGITKNENVLEG
jgi:DNA-binding XRE family transcriptional regulator